MSSVRKVYHECLIKGKMSTIRKICPEVSELTTVNTNNKCPVEDCNVVLKSKSNLNMHYIKHHLKSPLQKEKASKNEILQFHCPKTSCVYNITSNKFFTHKRFLKQHYLKVHADKIFTCAKCSKGFSTEAVKNSHEKICGKIFKCPDCNWEYKSSEALLTHCRRKNHRKTICDISHNNTEKKANVPHTSFVAENVIIINVLPPSFKLTQHKHVQTDSSHTSEKHKFLIKNRKRKMQQTQQTQTSVFKGKKHKTNVETQTKNSILEKAMYCANINTNGSTIETRIIKEPKYLNNSNENINIDIKIEKTEPTIEADNLPAQNYFDESSAYYLDIKPDMKNTDPENIFVNKILPETTLNQNNLCSIETQTEKNSLLNENTDSSFTQTPDISFDHLLYSNMYTQTCNDFLLSELGFNDSHTQTYWPEYEDLVSTQTQTTFTDYLFGDQSTQTKPALPDHLLEQSEYTQTYFNSSHGS